MASVLFLFLDGVGLGADDPRRNPFVAAPTPFLRSWLGGPLSEPLPGGDGEPLLLPLDATLGHSGLPQSATGQGTLLTGENCADAMGGHYGPWPGPTLTKLIGGRTLFDAGQRSAGGAVLANAYPPAYFAALQRRRARVNVPVHAARSAGVQLAGLADYSRGEAIAADLTGTHFHSLDPRLPTFTPQQAGMALAALAGRYDFTFFDFWLTDRIGHRGTFSEAVALAQQLDAFMEGLTGALGEVTLVLTSDHGNFEDKSTRGHTRAHVPLIATGPDREVFTGCRTLLDVAPAVRRILQSPR